MTKIVVFTPSVKSPTYAVALSGFGNQSFKKAGEYKVPEEVAAYLFKSKSDLFKEKVVAAPKKPTPPKAEEAPAEVEKPKARPSRAKVKKED